MNMRRFILILFLSMFFVANSVYATNVKITALTEESAPISTDLVGAMVDDPGGTPITKKVTFANLFGSAANVGASTVVTTGALDSGSITSNFGTINNGASDITTTGDITGGTHAATSDTSAADIASMGYTASEGLILTGQGSTYDVVIKNDADAIVASILTGTTDFDIVGTGTATNFMPDGVTGAGLSAAIGYTATEGIIITGQGSNNDVTIKNDADADVITIPTGATGVVFAGTTDVSSGTVTGPSGSWDTGGIDIATTDTYAIAGTDVIDNATTFSSGMVTSSLTTVGALASGSIATGFGNIATGGTVTIGVDGTGADVKFFGDSAGAFMLYDESADTFDVRGASAAGVGVAKLTTGELTNVDGGILGRLEFQAPLDSAGTDAILVAASIWAEADDTFAADNNTTDLVFATAVSETAVEKMRLTSAGEVSLVSGTLTLSDGGTVTQGAGSGKATAVTLSTYSGQITTDNASLAAGVEVTFTVTNTVVTALDVIVVSIADSPDGDSEIMAFVSDVTSGAYDITLSNLSGNEDTGAIVINVVVLRGASS